MAATMRLQRHFDICLSFELSSRKDAIRNPVSRNWFINIILTFHIAFSYNRWMSWPSSRRSRAIDSRSDVRRRNDHGGDMNNRRNLITRAARARGLLHINLKHDEEPRWFPLNWDGVPACVRALMRAYRRCRFRRKHFLPLAQSCFSEYRKRIGYFSK